MEEWACRDWPRGEPGILKGAGKRGWLIFVCRFEAGMSVKCLVSLREGPSLRMTNESPPHALLHCYIRFPTKPLVCLLWRVSYQLVLSVVGVHAPSAHSCSLDPGPGPLVPAFCCQVCLKHGLHVKIPA